MKPNMILHETLAFLEIRKLIVGKSIRSISLTPYFTVVQLDDGSVGAAMSYYSQSDELCKLIPSIISFIEQDPLLLRGLFYEDDLLTRLGVSTREAQLLANSLRTAIISALSFPCLESGGDGTFVVSQKFPFNPFAEAKRAVVIGFGGYIDALAKADQIKHLHISDLQCSTNNYMHRTIAKYQNYFPRKNFTFSDGTDIKYQVENADVVTITGSTLCNGTLEEILEYTKSRAIVVVQGQSASIYPMSLFNRGVNLVVTTLKPSILVQLAANDKSGQNLRPYLERGLPSIYLSPLS
ncbi:MAG: hypothetical protein HY819_21585 [Acidobacteria bacterium]|nr:hypothetical protein [Acidobacteriota bacterium]